MAMVPAICTQCGGKILVDDTHDAGICEFCGTAFITEKAIINYKNTINVDNAVINVVGMDAKNLLLRAKRYEEENNYDKAIEYYNRVLDYDINNEEANEGLKRLDNHRSNDHYIGLIEVDPATCTEIENLMSQGQKIAAIKVVRDTTGYGLAAAKYFVENHANGVWEEYDLNKKAYGNSSGSSQSGGCYVATAIYGSYDCPQVWTLRRYRDSILAATWYGRTFIRSYYAVSPTLVKWFGKKEWFKYLWKPTLDKMVESLNMKGVADTPYQDINW